MAINMDAVLELTAKVDGQAAVLALTRAIEQQTQAVNHHGKAAKDTADKQAIWMAAGVALGSVLKDAAYQTMAFAQASVQAGFNLAQTETRLRMLSEGFGEYDAVQQLVAQNAALLGQSQIQAASGFADIYARLRPLGISLQDVNNVYLGFNSLAMQSGTTAEAASGAFMQLSQALGSGTLRGDEFNSVAEQVPGILTEVAQVMGQPVGALRGLAAEGKITSTVVIEAMRNAAAEGGANLEQLQGSASYAGAKMAAAFSDMQALIAKELVPAFAELARFASELATNFTALMVPAIRDVVAEAQMLGFYFENLSKYSPELRQIGVELDAVGIAQKSWLESAVEIPGVLDTIAIALPPMVGNMVRLFNNELVRGFLDGLRAMSGVDAARLDVLNKQALAWNEQVKKQQEAKQKAEELNASAERQRKELELQNGAKERFKGLLESVKTEYEVYESQLQFATAEIASQNDVLDAQKDIYKTTLDYQKQEAEQRLKVSKSYKEDAAALLELRNLAIRNAEIAYQAADNSIAQANTQKSLEADKLELKLLEAQATLDVAEAEGQVTEAHRRSVQTALAAYQLALRQMDATVDRGKLLLENARIERMIAIDAAEFTYQQELAEAQTKRTQDAMVALSGIVTEVGDGAARIGAEIEAATTHTIRLHDEIREVDLAVVRVSRGWMSVQQETLLAAEAAYNYQESIQDTAERIRDLREEGTIEARRLADAIRGTLNLEQLLGVDTALRRMATGGYVTKPTPALIGEGGEPEYVIPASKMAAASTAFLGGARGSQVLQPATSTSSGPMAVNIQTGPVMSMGGQQYVSKTDLSMAVTQAVQQTMALLTGNSNVRQLVGV